MVSASRRASATMSGASFSLSAPSTARSSAFWRRALQPLALHALALSLRPLPRDLLGSIPDDQAAIEVAPEHFADGRGSPRSRASPRRGDAVHVQRLRDPREPGALRIHLEDAPDHRGLIRVDHPVNVSVAVPDVVVAEHTTARDRAGLCATA